MCALLFLSFAQVHAVMKGREEDTEMEVMLFAMNEFDRVTDWKKKIDTHLGQVLATELKNNAAKLAKWTIQSLLSGADIMKIG
jgi:translation initiation factor 3 subunit D